MEHGAFSTSESENDHEAYRAETSRAAARRALMERSSSHAATGGQVTYYAVLASDLCADFVDVEQYHMKLLTPVDVHHLFKGTQELHAMIMEVEFGRGSYLVMLADEMHRDPTTQKVATVMAAPNLAVALTKLDVGFSLNVRFDDGRFERLPLSWKLSADGEQLHLQIESSQTIAVTASHKNEMVTYDVHFSRGGEPLMDFVMMRGCTTVGEFAYATPVDATVIDRARNRLLIPSSRTERVGVSLESYARVKPDDDPLHRTIPAMENGATAIRDVRAKQTRTLTSYECWQNITKTHLTADGGWYHMAPGRQYAHEYDYTEGELTVAVHVYAEDEVRRAFHEQRAQVENAIAARQIKHCTAAMKNIERARIRDRAGEDPADMAYMTMDESYVRAVDSMRDKASTPEDAAELMMADYYVIHRFRAQFGEDAFMELVFPQAVRAILGSDAYAAKLKADLLLTEQYVMSEAVKRVMELEQNEGVPRVVLLRDWSLHVPASFVGATLTKMIDSDVYRTILEASNGQRAVQKSVVATRDVASTSGMWTFLARALGLFTSCSNSRNAYSVLKQ